MLICNLIDKIHGDLLRSQYGLSLCNDWDEEARITLSEGLCAATTLSHCITPVECPAVSYPCQFNEAQDTSSPSCNFTPVQL